MGQIRDISELHPVFKPLVVDWLAACNAKGMQLLVVETRRTMDVMTAYYARGRQPLPKVNDLYRKAGLRPITKEENWSIITKAMPGYSWHYFGLAIDVVPLINGVPDWNYNPDDPKDYYDEMANNAMERGMIWGGNFRSFPDRPHIEFHPGWSTSDSKTGVKAAYAASLQLGTYLIPLKGLYGPRDFQFPI